MANDHVAIAEAVKDSLNGASASLSRRVQAERNYSLIMSRSDSPLRLVVLPQSDESINPSATRTPHSQHDYGIQVALIEGGMMGDDGQFDVKKIDDLIFLMQEIKDHLRDAGKMAGATLIGITHSPIYDSEHLQGKGSEFRSAITFTYRGIRVGE